MNSRPCVFDVGEGLVYAARFFTLERFFCRLCPLLRLLLDARALLFALAHRFGEFALRLVFRVICHAGIMAQLLGQSDSTEVHGKTERTSGFSEGLVKYGNAEVETWGHEFCVRSGSRVLRGLD